MIDKEELEAFVSKVRDRSDIFSVVSRYVTLKSKGNQYWGCCPFHSEDHASFIWNRKAQSFHCFGFKSSNFLSAFAAPVSVSAGKVTKKYSSM